MYDVYSRLSTYTIIISSLNYPINKMSESTQTQMTVIDGKYYKIENKPMLYDIRFPLAWAIAINTQTKKMYCNFGPGWCWDCRDKGILNGVFVGFCNYCAVERLDGKYGAGAETPIDELSKEEIWRIYPYMEGTSIQDIGIPPTEEKNDFAPFQSREHMETYEKAQRERLSLVQEQDQDQSYRDHAILVSMCRAALDNNRGPMTQQMSWAEYREYLLEDLLG